MKVEIYFSRSKKEIFFFINISKNTIKKIIRKDKKKANKINPRLGILPNYGEPYRHCKEYCGCNVCTFGNERPWVFDALEEEIYLQEARYEEIWFKSRRQLKIYNLNGLSSRIFEAYTFNLQPSKVFS
jgi:hypothetical protein